MSKGLIIKSISGEFTIIGEETITCKPRGLFRYQDMCPKTGDYVEYDSKTKSITKIFQRKNDLIRPSIANVDKVLVVFSVKEPNLNLTLLDKMLATYEYNDIECVLIFTKLDLLDDQTDYQKAKAYYQSIGYQVLESSHDISIDTIRPVINDSICVLSGESGVGKSTILNKLGYDIKTSEISLALNRGKHTTRHVELLPVGTGYIADTPGFGAIDLEMDEASLGHAFVEFYQNQDKCQFNGCLHQSEPNCEIKRLVNEKKILPSRYDNYLLFLNEIKGKRRY